MYSQDVLEDLRHASDIVEVVGAYVPLRQQGANHMGLCPFHKERSPSFSVSATRQLFHCFGCGVGGNVYSFVMKIENFTFMDAVQHLAAKVNYRLPERVAGGTNSVSMAEKNRMHEAYRLAARYYYDNLQSPAGRVALEHVNQRGIVEAVQRRFGLGFSTQGGLTDFLREQGFEEAFLVKAGLSMEGTRGFYDRFRGRLMFPIFEVGGKVIGFGGRIIGDGEPKYLNSPETPVFDKSRTLYGLNYARLAKQKSLILVEGYMDVIALHQVGIKNAVAALGTALTEKHAKMLKRYCDDVVILFDSDAAGVKAALRAIPHLYAAGLGIQVLNLQDAKDPDDYIQAFGVDALLHELEAARDFVDFQVSQARRGVDMEQTAQRIAFIKACAAIIARLASPVERQAYTADMAAKYGMDEPSLKEEVKEILGKGDDEYIAPRRPMQAAPQGLGHGDAAAHVLWQMSDDKGLCEKITSHLTGEEFGDPVYRQLYEAILAAWAAGRQPEAGYIVGLVEGEEGRAKASKILIQPPNYEDAQNALAQQLSFLRQNHLRAKLAQVGEDIEEMQRLTMELNALKREKISL